MGFKVEWTPDLEQDLDAMTTKGSLVYDAELTKRLVDEYGSIDAFKQSDKFKDIVREFKNS
jgi:hypothetical protein